MDKLPLKTNVVTQIAFVVSDVEKTAGEYADFLGIEKPQIKETADYEFTKVHYKGKPTKARARIAILQVGRDVRLELIQPDAEPSTWREGLDAGEGFHHIAFEVKDIDHLEAVLEKNGMPVVQKGHMANGRYTYVDARKQLKSIIEMLEHS